MQKLIKNTWQRKPGAPFACARILVMKSIPEGLDVDRFRFFEAEARAETERRSRHQCSARQRQTSLGR